MDAIASTGGLLYRVRLAALGVMGFCFITPNCESPGARSAIIFGSMFTGASTTGQHRFLALFEIVAGAPL